MNQRCLCPRAFFQTLDKMRQHCAIISRFYDNHSDSASHVISRHIYWSQKKLTFVGNLLVSLHFLSSVPPELKKKEKNEETHSETVLCLVYTFKLSLELCRFLKKNLNASKPYEHPPVRGENVKTFRWDHRLQIQNLFMAFERVPRWQ